MIKILLVLLLTLFLSACQFTELECNTTESDMLIAIEYCKDKHGILAFDVLNNKVRCNEGSTNYIKWIKNSAEENRK